MLIHLIIMSQHLKMMVHVLEYFYGCTNPLAYNYNPLANTDDFSCENVLYGCTDHNSLNFQHPS